MVLHEGHSNLRCARDVQFQGLFGFRVIGYSKVDCTIYWFDGLIESKPLLATAAALPSIL